VITTAATDPAFVAHAAEFDRRARVQRRSIAPGAIPAKYCSDQGMSRTHHASPLSEPVPRGDLRGPLRARRRRSSGWLRRVYPGGVERCTGDLAAAALTRSD
jgi:hypothetical protein